MNPPQPPPRSPHYDWEEDGGTREHAARFLIERFVSVINSYEEWRAPSFTATLYMLDEAPGFAMVGFKSTLGDGRIEFSIGHDGWVLAEIYKDDDLWRRAWCECAYEEPSLWPDGSDGEDKDKEPAARMSKRCWWITFWHSWGWPSFSIEAAGLDD
ncbi:MAG: hypothetical protein ABW199_03395 [Caulobacterales bacterium]